MRFYEVWKAGSVGVDGKRFLRNFLYSYESPCLTQYCTCWSWTRNGETRTRLKMSFIQSLKILSSWFRLPEISVSRVWTLFWCFEVFACNTWWTCMQTSFFRREMMEILPMESINGRFSSFHSWTQLPTPHQSKQQIFWVNWKNNKFDLSFCRSSFQALRTITQFMSLEAQGRRCHVTIKRSRHCASWRMHFATISFWEWIEGVLSFVVLFVASIFVSIRLADPF